MTDYPEMLALLKAHGQEHIFSHWHSLTPQQQQELMDDCRSVDLDWIADRRRELADADARPDADIAPAPVVRLPSTPAEEREWREAEMLGENILRQGKAAAFLVAGGQGTRLGFDGPKGCFPVGPLSGRTLFQWHAEQILARSRRYGAAIPWYIMTSRENDAPTRDFFEKNGFFGLPRSDVAFFSQDMVPCLDFEGGMLLADASSLAMNPNGHGGSLSGLRTSGALADMRRRGIEYISYFQVDNPLVVICDPLFLGWHVKTGSEMSSKVLRKLCADEKTGVACLVGGKPGVVEYIDLDDARRNALDGDGQLLYWAGSIAIHVLDVAFVERMTESGCSLPWHRSRKRVAFFREGRVVKPAGENAVKFETFVFDALPFARRTMNLEVRREREFAPIKNASGVDSAESSRALLSSCFVDWLSVCGVEASGAVGAPVVEISPLYSLDAVELASKLRPGGFRLERGLLLE